MRKKVLWGVVVLSVALLFLGDRLLALGVAYYIRSAHQIHCSIGRIRLTPQRVTAENIVAANNTVNLAVVKLSVSLEYRRFLRPRIGRVLAEDFNCIIKGVHGIDADLKGERLNIYKIAGEGPFLTGIQSCAFNLSNSTVAIHAPGQLEVRTHLSFGGVVEGGRMERVSDLEIFDFDGRFKDVIAITDLTVTHENKESYTLAIPHLQIKGKTLQDISFPFVIEDGAVAFLKSQQTALGLNAYLEGRLTHTGFNTFCLNVSLTDCAAAEVIRILRDNDDIIFSGVFNGDLEYCVDATGISLFQGNFSNSQGGVLQVKKEISVGFLRDRLDEKTYNVLIDSVRNYRYNTGTIGVGRKDGGIVLTLSLDSQEMGKRNIILNFHGNP